MLPQSKAEIIHLILAAGASNRMGAPKQLLPWKKSTCIEQVIAKLSNENNVTTYVVLGAYYELIASKIANYPIRLVHNTNWQSGMGTSISSGVQAVLANERYSKAILISTVDQPLIDSHHLLRMISSFEKNSDKIIATDLGNVLGVPVIFPKCFFKQLKELENDHGARYIVKNNSDQVIPISGKGKGIDMDTIEEYKLMYKQHHPDAE